MQPSLYACLITVSGFGLVSGALFGAVPGMGGIASGFALVSGSLFGAVPGMGEGRGEKRRWCHDQTNIDTRYCDDQHCCVIIAGLVPSSLGHAKRAAPFCLCA